MHFGIPQHDGEGRAVIPPHKEAKSVYLELRRDDG